MPLKRYFLCAVVWCGGHIEVGRYLGSARNGVRGTSGNLERVCSEAVLSRGRGPGIHNLLTLHYYDKVTSISSSRGRLVNQLLYIPGIVF